MPAEAHATPNRAARLAGALYIALMPFSFFGILYVPSVLLVPDDPATTARNILASEWMLRSGTVSHLIGQILFIFLALTLHRLLKVVNRDQAVLMVILVLVSVPIAFLNEVHHLTALRLLETAPDGAFTTAQVQTQAMLHLDMRLDGILIAQIFWGLWLLPLGFLVIKSGFLPKLLGLFVVIAGAGYVFDCATQLLSPGFPTIAQFTFVGELLFPLWLLIRGVDVAQWQVLAHSPGAA